MEINSSAHDKEIPKLSSGFLVLAWQIHCKKILIIWQKYEYIVIILYFCRQNGMMRNISSLPK